MKIIQEYKKLEITYEVKGLIYIKYLLYLIMVVGPIYNFFKFVLPQNDELMSIILKGLAGGAFWIIIVIFILNYVNQHLENQDRKIIFDNNKKELKDDDKVYSYDDIKDIEVVHYSDYLENEDERAIDGTTVKNYKSTFVARIELENDNIIALYIGSLEKCKKTVEQIKTYLKN